MANFIFTGERAAFGRHETFSLRYGWLTKGIQALNNNPKVFETDDATVTLGVGKNMVHSIKYWLQATQMAKMKKNHLEITNMGELIFGKNGWDPYLEDEATIWLLHWLMATNSEQATTIYWFFNKFHKPEFSNQEVTSALLDFTRESIKSKFAATTIKQDITTLLRMYVQSKGNTRTPIEEALDSPLSALKLISYIPNLRLYQYKPDDREELPIGIIGYAIADFFERTGEHIVPIEGLMYRRDGLPSIGSVFCLSENGLLGKIEKIIRHYPEFYELRESAGIHQLYELKKVKPLSFLEEHYKTESLKVVA